MKNVLVFDTNPDRRKAHCAAFISDDYIVFQYANGNIEALSNDASKMPSSFDLILLHANDKPPFGSGCFTVAGPVLLYSGAGRIQGGVPRAVTQNSPLTKEELESFLSNFQAFDQNVQKAIDATWVSAEHQLALRLLCESYMLEPSCRSQPAGKETDSGLTIHCPEPKEWFSVFGKEATAKAAQEIARLMGDPAQQAAAENLLTAIADSTPNDLTELVGQFLNPTETNRPPASLS